MINLFRIFEIMVIPFLIYKIFNSNISTFLTICMTGFFIDLIILKIIKILENI
jgi:hypothetical protein